MIAALALAFSWVAPQTVAIENVSIIVPGKGQAISGRTVLIENGAFSEVGAAASVKVPLGARRIDGRGKFLIPGLWDMHVHWYDEKALSLFTANGVTGIRQMFGFPMHLDWRARAERGDIVGPRIMAGSNIVDGPEPLWEGSIAVKDPKDAAGIVAKIMSEKWDFMKVYSYLPRAQYLALAAEAKKQGVAFAGHVPLSVSVIEAGRLGQRTNEHLGGILLDLWPPANLHELADTALKGPKPLEAVRKLLTPKPGEQLEPVDPSKVKALARDLAKTKMWQCPTLVVLRSMAHLDQESFTKDDRLKYMSKEMRDLWNPANDFRLKSRTPKDWEMDRVAYGMKKSLVKPLFDAGNRFLAGTDCLNPFCFPGFSLHDELALMVEAGLTPTQALETATINPARFVGQDRKWGLIARGMRADAVLLDRNPLVDIRNTTSIRSVIQGSKFYGRAELDAMLKSNEIRSSTGEAPLPHLCPDHL